jgi:hypothetical protein
MSTNTTSPIRGDAAELQQKLFKERVGELDVWRKKFYNEVIARRFFAYLLKCVSIFGAIIVAVKISWIDQTVLGLTIAAAIGLDQLTSNHARLLSIAAARYACERLRAKIVSKHSRELPAIVRLRNAGSTDEAKTQFESLMSGLMTEIFDGQEKILEAVQGEDLKALNNLYVDVRT